MVLRLRTMNLEVMGSNHIEWPHLPSYFREAFTDCLGLPSMKHVSLSRIDKFPIVALGQCATLSLDGRFDFSNSCFKSYPRLVSLTIYYWSGMFPDIIAWAKKINLRHLDICIPGIDKCAMLFQVCPMVTTLDLDFVHKREFSHCVFVFHLHLTFHIVQTHGNCHLPIFTPEFTLSPFANLQHLTIYVFMSFPWYSGPEEHHTSLPVIIKFLKTAPTIKHLSLRFHYNFNGDSMFLNFPPEFAHIAKIPSIARIHLYVSARRSLHEKVLPSRILSLLECNDILMDMVKSGVLVLRGELHTCRHARCRCRD